MKLSTLVQMRIFGQNVTMSYAEWQGLYADLVDGSEYKVRIADHFRHRVRHHPVVPTIPKA